MATPSPIEMNIADTQAISTRTQQAQVGKFASVYDGLGYAANMAGPVAVETAAYKSTPRAAAIVSAAVNATPGGGGLGYGGYASAPYFDVGVRASTTGSTIQPRAVMGQLESPLVNAQEMIQNIQASGVQMLELQTVLGQESLKISTLSQTIAKKQDMEAQVVRNVGRG